MKYFGWKPDTPDFRDFRFKEKVEYVEEPPVKYLICAPIKNQLNLGSCVFNGISSAMENADIEVRNIIPPVPYSRLYAYYKYRELEGIPINYDSGASIREAIKIIAKNGICLESVWPYDLDYWASKPSKEADLDAENHKILEYYALTDLKDMIQSIASGWGFVCGIGCYESFDSDYTEKTGKVLVPQPNERFLGGHCIYFWGYDKHLFDGEGGFHFQNSYGAEWGKKGRGTIPFSYLSNRNLATDFWTIRK